MGFSRSDVEIVVVDQGAAAGAAAWHLARAGRGVLLLPARSPGEDASAEVTVPSRTGTTGPAADLADAAVPLWRALEDETAACLLSLTSGVDHSGVDHSGVGHSGGRTADLARELTARGHRARHGVRAAARTGAGRARGGRRGVGRALRLSARRRPAGARTASAPRW